jgi:PKD repeat protein
MFRAITPWVVVACGWLSWSWAGAQVSQTVSPEDGSVYELNPERCGTMQNFELLKQSYPAFEKNLQRLEELTEELAANPKPKGPGAKNVITIPVVYHIVWRQAAENISDNQIITQQAVLNEDFRRLNADASATLAQFQGVAADSEIEFCLAKRDPQGNPTTGIVRYQTNTASFSTNNGVKSAATGGANPWPVGQYLNIWVCNLSGGTLGYAQFPGGPANTDGVVLNYRYVGRGGSAQQPYAGGRTGTHEVGHWLNLRHIWGDANCGNDQVADTPPASGPHYGCPLNAQSCGGLNMVQNYMDYSDDNCMNLFTLGQKTRMLAALTGPRASLLNSLGCVPPNAPPTAQFTASTQTTCPNIPITFTDQSTGNPTQWSWSFPGGTPSSFTGQNPPAVVYSAPGTYTVSLTVTNSFGSDPEVKNGYITITNAAQPLPFTESFEAANALNAWQIQNPDNATTWQLATITGTTPGNRAATVNHFNYTATGQRDGLVSPALDFSGYSSVSLYFEHAYRRRQGGTTAPTDSLILWASTNCGQTWQRIVGFGENGQGVWATAGTNTNNFVPANANEWCFGTLTNAQCQTVSLNALAGQPNVRLRFQSFNNNSNNVYIDNINIQGTLVAAPPVAQFTASPLTGCAPLTVSFTDQSTGVPSAWFWDVDNNGIADYTTKNVTHTYTTPGTYSVQLIAENAQGSDVELKTAYIVVNPSIGTPTITQSPADACVGGSLALTVSGVTAPGATYSWAGPGGFTSTQQNPTRPNLTSAAAGTYTVTVTANGCTATATTLVAVGTAGTPVANANTPVCVGQALVLSADSIPGVAYQWAGPNGFTASTQNATLPNAQVAATGTYTLTTSANGCTATATVAVTVSNQGGLPLPFQESFENGLGAQNWNVVNPDGGITWEAFAPVQGITPGNRAARVNLYNYESTGQRDYLDSPLLSFAGYSDITMTFDHAHRRYSTQFRDSLIISISADCGQSWQRLTAYAENGTGSFATSPTTTNNFIPATAADWCFAGTNPAPNCKSINLTPYAGNPAVRIRFETYNDYGNNIYIDNININGTPCNLVSTFSTSQTTVCPGQPVTVQFAGSAAPNTTFTWDFDGGTVVSGSGAGPYQVSWATAGPKAVKLIIGAGNCTSQQTIQNITVSGAGQAPTITASSPAVCPGQPVTVSTTAVPGATYTWTYDGGTPTPGGSAASQSVTWATAGPKTITLVVVAGGCTTSVASQTITVNAAGATPVINASTLTACANAPVTVSTPPVAGAVYLWNFGGGVANPPVGTTAPTANLTWSTPGVKVVSLSQVINGCTTAVASQSITINAGPSLPVLQATTTETCVNTPLTLGIQQPQPNVTYVWSFDGGTATANPANTQQSITWSTPGTKTVTVVAIASGCTTAVQTQAITVFAALAANAGPDVAVCAGAVTQLNPPVALGAGCVATWSPATGLSSPAVLNPFAQPSATTTYTLTISCPGGCAPASDAVVVTVTATPVVSLPPAYSICEGQVAELQPQGVPAGAAVQWAPALGLSDAAIANPTATPAQTTTYTLTVSDNGCSTTQTTTVQVVGGGSVPILTAQASAVCSGQPVVVEAPAATGAVYDWDFDGGTAQLNAAGNLATITWPDPGVKNVSLTLTVGGCASGLAQLPITVQAAPGAPVFKTEPTAICRNLPLTFDLQTETGLTYVWNLDNASVVDSTNGSVTVVWSTAGPRTVTVRAVSSAGCLGSTTFRVINVTDAPALPVVVFPDNIPCVGQTACFGLSNPALGWSAYQWVASGGAVVEPSDEGSFCVRWPGQASGRVGVVAVANGCASDTAFAVVNFAPNAPQPQILASDTVVALNEPVVLTGQPANLPVGSYQWNYKPTDNVQIVSGGSTANQTVYYTTPGLKTVYLTLTGCNPTTDSLIIRVEAPDTSTSVEDPVAAAYNLTLYPNPNRGQFTVSFYTENTSQEVLVSVIDATGRRIFSYPHDPTRGRNELTLDLGRLAKGAYSVRLSQGARSAARQFIVE